MRIATGFTLALLLVGGASDAAAQSQSSAWGRNGYISFGAIYQTSDTQFDEQARPQIHQEVATLTASHEVEPGPAFDLHAGGRLAGNLGMGFGVSYFRRGGTAGIDASVPHPFFFDRARGVSGQADDLTREERGIHVNLMWLLPVSERFQLAVFGGPSYFTVTQLLVDDLTLEESYPYDEARFTGVHTVERRGSRIGFHAGVDLSYYFAEYLGVGGVVRLARGAVDLDGTRGGTTRVDAGGTQVGAGLRVRF